ncbi:MAG TPA: slipin family protein [Puia sp.]|nr:slipin family protein [Puia sp.]
MKRVKINAYQKALVFKNGVYQRLLTEGNYWIGLGQKVLVYDLALPFVAPVELNILLKDERLKECLYIVGVRDNEIVLQYENGLLKQVLTAGRYAYWKGIVEYTFVTADISKIAITEDIDRTALLSKQVAPYVRTYNVEAYERAVLFVDGKYERTLDSGFYYWWKNNIQVYIGKVDTRLQQMEINGQEILTGDKTALRINAWARYQVADIETALLRNKEYDRQLYVAFQLALREYVAGVGFDELLEKKDLIMTYVLERVEKESETLGVRVAAFGIRDIVLPGDVKEIMNQVLIAEKKAQANIITRREETASTRSLLNTARLLEENPMLFKLKELEYVEKIAEKVSTISVNGSGVLIDQLRQLFGPPAK